MIKLLGIVLVFFSFCASGIYLGNLKGKRIRYVESLIYLIRHIRYKITYFRSEIKDIYIGFSNNFLTDCGFMKSLEKSALYKALSVYSLCYHVREYESGMLLNFASSLGRSSWEDQVDMCNCVSEMLEKYLDELKEKIPEEKKLVTSLGIIAGLLATVVLI